MDSLKAKDAAPLNRKTAPGNFKAKGNSKIRRIGPRYHVGTHFFFSLIVHQGIQWTAFSDVFHCIACMYCIYLLNNNNKIAHVKVRATWVHVGSLFRHHAATNTNIQTQFVNRAAPSRICFNITYIFLFYVETMAMVSAHMISPFNCCFENIFWLRCEKAAESLRTDKLQPAPSVALSTDFGSLNQFDSRKIISLGWIWSQMWRGKNYGSHSWYYPIVHKKNY